MSENGEDKDAVMLEELGNALIDLEVKFRASTLKERTELRPELERLLESYGGYRLKLLKEGVITGEDDLDEIRSIQQEIDSAAKKEALLKAILRTAVFVATKL